MAVLVGQCTSKLVKGGDHILSRYSHACTKPRKVLFPISIPGLQRATRLHTASRCVRSCSILHVHVFPPAGGKVHIHLWQRHTHVATFKVVLLAVHTRACKGAGDGKWWPERTPTPLRAFTASCNHHLHSRTLASLLLQGWTLCCCESAVNCKCWSTCLGCVYNTCYERRSREFFAQTAAAIVKRSIVHGLASDATDMLGSPAREDCSDQILKLHHSLALPEVQPVHTGQYSDAAALTAR